MVIYFHPFTCLHHYSGFWGMRWLPSEIALHAIAPRRTLSLCNSTQFVYQRTVAPGALPFANMQNPNDRIYILGHGDVGVDELSTENGRPYVQHTNEISSANLSALLIANGLPANSQCHIRVHACSSGVAGFHRPSFAYNLWTHISAFANGVTVRGYLGATSSYFCRRWTLVKQQNAVGAIIGNGPTKLIRGSQACVDYSGTGANYNNGTNVRVCMNNQAGVLVPHTNGSGSV